MLGKYLRSKFVTTGQPIQRQTWTYSRLSYVSQQDYLSIILQKSEYHSASKIGIAFDIDGVLLKGRQPIPAAAKALARVHENKIPFILLSNGGGVSEAQKAAEIAQYFNHVAPIHADQLVLAHTPMQDLVALHKNQPVLIIGPRSCCQVAQSYGFTRPYVPEDIVAANPSIWPFCTVPDTYTPKPLPPTTKSFGAILVMKDSLDWGRDIQVCLDLLRSQHGQLGTLSPRDAPQALPIYFANMDWCWANEYAHNRLAAGAFVRALQAVYVEECTNPLIYTAFGKPEAATYEFATRQLFRHKQKLHPFCGEFMYNFGIGDNPASDIEGANRNGYHSVLVKTGVWKGDDLHGAKWVVEDVEEAVDRILGNLRGN